ncbi:Leucine--tRNA ligase (Leucyl-tRNA synthetase) (LeuRS) [Durusdinium trenchii]|uniref:leucine--tRNA ligase n=1 Tax=Durusdinium trenchii TaxID=1381693 RepID=A0ABP0RXK3_9DINO
MALLRTTAKKFSSDTPLESLLLLSSAVTASTSSLVNACPQHASILATSPTLALPPPCACCAKTRLCNAVERDVQMQQHLQRGENGHPELTLEGLGCNLLGLFDQLVRNASTVKLTKLMQLVHDEAERSKNAELLTNLFVLAFQTRWCRGGKGEKKLFYTMMLFLYERHPTMVIELLDIVPEYGYWKDLFLLLEALQASGASTSMYEAMFARVVEICAKQHQEDMTKSKGLSLYAKFVPSEKSALDRKLKIVSALSKRLMGEDTMDRKARFRHEVSKMREQIKVTERLMSLGRYSEIEFSRVPSLCMTRHMLAFLNETKVDKRSNATRVRFPDNEDRVAAARNLMETIEEGTGVKGAQVFPHELVEKVYRKAPSARQCLVISSQWKSLRESIQKMVVERKKVLAADAAQGKGAAPIDLGNTVVMADVSGSMSGTPMLVSIAMGILCSEITTPAFRDMVLTFESTPRWHSLKKSSSFVDKVQSLASAPWGGSTNFMSAISMILDVAKRNKLKQEDIPNLMVVSDMQFDVADVYSERQYSGDAVTTMFRAAGYEPPKVIYWNVRHHAEGFPAAAGDSGKVLLSGYSAALMKFVLSGELETEDVVVDEATGEVNKVKRQLSPKEVLHNVLQEQALGPVRERVYPYACNHFNVPVLGEKVADGEDKPSAKGIISWEVQQRAIERAWQAERQGACAGAESGTVGRPTAQLRSDGANPLLSSCPWRRRRGGDEALLQEEEGEDQRSQVRSKRRRVEAMATPEKFPRRAKLRKIEEEIQTRWAAEKPFESDPDPSKEKFFVCFPYPYANGPLHGGHGFSFSKGDFTAAYQRLRGKNVLLPFAFHVTGMPIQAAAMKLKREMEMYGTPPVVPDEMEAAAEEEDDAAAKVGQFKSKKTKTSRKTGKVKLQWDILKLSGIAEEDIPKFADPLHWLDVFPRKAEEDLKRFGAHVDWRRAFITTTENPFYDQFIRWQFLKLREAGKIDFGRRPTIFSVIDKQACADHDRSKGEGVGPQEYTLIKLELLEPAKIKGVAEAVSGDARVFMVAATLRPETMYGQTNCFILPTGTYGVFAFDVEVAPKSKERVRTILVCSDRAARNMSFQDPFVDPGKQGTVEKLGTVSGADLVGAKVRAPKSPYDHVYCLPLLTISMNKGTGVVTSVPSDAPDDYAALRDWQNDDKLRAKHGVTEEMVAPFQVVPVIHIPGMGDSSAVYMCDKLKIKSQRDEKKLKEAKEETYKRGFYEGVMIVGEADGIKGMKVCDAKDVVKRKMCEDGEAILYFEPEKEVVSRTGDQCVVAYLDQWFLKYGEEEWANRVKEHVKDRARFETYTDATREAFVNVLDWMKEWACSRNFGLGTLVPWDEQFVIESLSDSTIYMAYYTIAHLLQGRASDTDYTGQKGTGSPLGIKPEQLTPEVFDYIFLGKAYPEGCGIEEAKLKQMQDSFEYWYPFDLRVSGRDLIQNHLTMSLYNHAAIWADRPEMWPKSMFCNGFIEVEAKKMAKSEGNFIMLDESCAGNRSFVMDGKEVNVGWTADTTRLALASAGDGLEDANFSCEVAETSILRLDNELTWAEEVTADKAVEGQRKEGKDAYNFFERAFDNQMDQAVADTQAAYDAMRYRDVAKHGFYSIQGHRDSYRDACARAGIPLNTNLVLKFLEVSAIIMSPIVSHVSEKVWADILKKPGFVCQASWPTAPLVGTPDISVLRSADFLHSTVRAVRVAITKELTNRKKKKLPNADEPIKKVVINIETKFPEFQIKIVEFLRSSYDAALPDKFPADIMKQLKKLATSEDSLKKNMKSVMQRASFIIAQVKGDVGEAALEVNIPFDQEQVLRDNYDFAVSAMELDAFELQPADPAAVPRAEPGSPSVSFP